jgi:hypothetical protein
MRQANLAMVGGSGVACICWPSGRSHGARATAPELRDPCRPARQESRKAWQPANSTPAQVGKTMIARRLHSSP